jgi:sugar diacid utilization regulator
VNTPASISVAVQDMIDSLAERLTRAVALVDPSISPLYISRHYGDQDHARIQSMLQREPSPELRRYILDSGVTRWRHADVIEGNESLGLKARLCVPLYGPGWLIGVLMVVDADGQLTSEEVTEITHFGQKLTTQLHSDSLSTDRHRVEDARRTRQLLDPTDPYHATAIASATEAIGANMPYSTVSVIRVDSSHETGVPTQAAMQIVMESLSRGEHAERHFYIDVDATLAVLLHVDSKPSADADLRAESDAITVDLRRLLGPSSVVLVGVGHSDGGLSQAWEAHRRAKTALRAATRRAAQSTVAIWRELGIDALLLEIPDPSLRWSLVPPGLQTLVQRDTSGKLVETLRTYLDHVGSVSRTAEALHLHRTSLYYRLDQIGKLTGADLDDGRDRLLLHAGLHLIDLIGQSE